MTTVTGSDRRNRLDRLERRRGAPTCNSIEDVQAVLAGITNLNQAKVLLGQLLVTVLLLRERLERR